MQKGYLFFAIIFITPFSFGDAGSIYEKPITNDARYYVQRDMYENRIRKQDDTSPAYNDVDYNAMFGRKLEQKTSQIQQTASSSTKEPQEEYYEEDEADMPEFAEPNKATNDMPNFSAPPPMEEEIGEIPNDEEFIEGGEYYEDDQEVY